MSNIADRRRERLEQERELLARAFPTSTLDIDLGVVIVGSHRIPDGWSHSETDVLVEIPEQYPSTPPDNVCARDDLTLADGSLPQNNQGHHEIAGRRWLQFSYHIDASEWRPDVDLAKSSTLVDYLTGALSRFEEVS
jgi:hypothetical protein